MSLGVKERHKDDFLSHYILANKNFKELKNKEESCFIYLWPPSIPPPWPLGMGFHE